MRKGPLQDLSHITSFPAPANRNGDSPKKICVIFNVRSETERIRRYRRYMYEAGSIDRPDKGKVKVIDPRILAKQKNKDFEIT